MLDDSAPGKECACRTRTMSTLFSNAFTLQLFLGDARSSLSSDVWQQRTWSATNVQQLQECQYGGSPVERDLDADVECDLDADVERDLDADVERNLDADVERDLEADITRHLLSQCIGHA